MGALEDLENLQFEEFVSSTVYNSSDQYEIGVLASYYDMTVNFMESVIPNPVSEELRDTVLNGSTIDVYNVVTNYIGLIVLASLILAFTILMPISGSIFCCCLCCKKQQLMTENKRNKKIAYSVILLISVALLFFAMVSAYMTNDKMYDGTTGLMDDFKDEIDDIFKYFDDTVDHAEFLMDKNFLILKDAVDDCLNEAPNELTTVVEEAITDSNVESVFDFIDQMGPIKDNLKEVEEESTNVLCTTNELDDSINQVKTLFVDFNCKEDLRCELIVGTTDLLNVDKSAVSHLTRFKTQVSTVKDLISNTMINNIGEAKEIFDSIVPNIRKETTEQLKIVKKSIDETKDAIFEQKDNIVENFKNISKTIRSKTDYVFDFVKDYINEYAYYPYYINVCFATILLVIVIMLLVGLIFGMLCGKNTGNRSFFTQKRSSGLLLWTVCIMFVVSLFLGALMVVHLMAVFPHVFICEPFRNPSTSETFIFYSDVLENKTDFEATLKEVFESIRNNESIYKTIKYEKIYNITEELPKYIEEFDIEAELEIFRNAVKEQLDELIILSSEDEETIKGVAKDMKNFHEDVNALIKTLNDQEMIEGGTIQGLINRVTELIDEVNNGELELDNEKLSRALSLYKSSQTSLQNLEADIPKFGKKVKETSELLKFGKKSFTDALVDLLDQIKNVESSLINLNSVITLAETYVTSIVHGMESYLNWVVEEIDENLGRTTPISNTLDAFLVTTCDKIVLPMGGYSLSLLWTMVIFVPTVIFASLLANLYGKIVPPKRNSFEFGLKTYDIKN